MKRRLIVLGLVLALSLLCACGAYKPVGQPTGNAELDSQVLAVLEEVCDKKLSAEENAAKVYNWVANEIKYRAGTADTSGGFTESLIQELALELIVCVMVNAGKNPMFTLEERAELIRRVTRDLPNVEVDGSSELLADYAKRRGNCDGEAALMAVLLERMGWETVIVEGRFARDDSGQMVDHAWVIARMDGTYFHFDPLYGRHYAEDRINDYCMADDARMEQTHQWDRAAYPACD